MFTLEEAARAVGLSERQLRRRVEATAPLLAPYVRRGDKNRLLLDQGAVEILRDVEARRASGATLQDARAWVAVSVRGEHGSEQGRVDGAPGASAEPVRVESWAVSALIEEKDRTIRRLEAENDRLRTEVDRLLPLALPAPRRRSLWPFGRRAVSR